MSGFWLTEEQEAIREGVAKVCAAFDDEYWRRTDETGIFPEASSPPSPRAAGWAWPCRKVSAARAWA
jgi:hypothetical protein